MKIIQNISWHGKECEVCIFTAIEGTISDAADECGIAEMGNEKANKAAEILGKLIQALHRRNLLTDSEVADMIGWRYTVEE